MVHTELAKEMQTKVGQRTFVEGTAKSYNSLINFVAQLIRLGVLQVNRDAFH